MHLLYFIFKQNVRAYLLLALALELPSLLVHFGSMLIDIHETHVCVLVHQLNPLERLNMLFTLKLSGVNVYAHSNEDLIL